MIHQDNSNFDGIIDVAMGTDAERASVMCELKQAILTDRLHDALLCICKLAGIEPTDAVKSFQDPETASR